MTDPANIRLTDWEVSDYWWLHSWTGWQGEMTVKDHYAYFIHGGWLIIVDVTDPFDPHKVSTIDLR